MALSLIAELQRRNVFKVGAAYLALAWVVAMLMFAVDRCMLRGARSSTVSRS